MKQALITCGIYLYSTLQQKVLVCHATGSRWNSWSIPKGLPEAEEGLYAAAIRELYEETGIKSDELHVLKMYALEPVKYQKQNKILESFLIITDSDLTAQKFVCHSYTEQSFPEVDKWKWISLQDAEGMLHEAQQKNLPAIRQFVKSYK